MNSEATANTYRRGHQRKLTRREFALGAAVLAGSTLLGGCSRSDGTVQASAGTKEGGTLRYAISNPACIDPIDCTEQNGLRVTALLFDSLLSFNAADSAIVPCAAQSYEMSEDATEFTFSLVPGALFHNGEAVTSASFKRAWERIVAASVSSGLSGSGDVAHLLSSVVGFESLRAGVASDMSGLETPDDLTLRVRLSSPYFDFPYVLTHPALGPVPAVAQTDPRAFYVAPVGNGPFQMNGAWIDGQSIQLTRFDGYYGVKPYLDGVDFTIFKDEDTSYAEFRAGNLDFCSVPFSEIATARSSYNSSPDGMTANPDGPLLLGPENATSYLALKLSDPLAMGNRNFRKAISLAIDREGICKEVYASGRTPATGIVPPDTPGYRHNAWEYCRYDTVAAAAALVDAGYPEGAGAPVVSLVCYEDAATQAVMQRIITDLAGIGLLATVETLSWTAFLKRVSGQGQGQAAPFSWAADYPGMEAMLTPLFATGVVDNRSHYVSDFFDEGAKAARLEADADKRREAWQILDAMVGEDLPIIPLTFFRHHHISSQLVNDLYVDFFSRPSLENCWITTD